MGLVKRDYVDQMTVITAENLNAIQDAIIANEEAIEEQGEAIGGKYTKPSGGIPASDTASGVQTSLGKADSAYQKPSGGIPASDMASGVQTSLGKADSAYQKPSGGIPASDMASGVQTSLDKADSAYQKPSGGIPASDMASGVQTSLDKADSALQGSDIDNTLSVTGKAADAKKTGDEISDVRTALNSKAETDASNISSASTWRSALGLGTSGSLPITVSQGGTGSTGVETISTISDIITAASGYTIINAAIKRWGKVVMLYLAVKKSTAVTTVQEMDIGTISSAYRPVSAAPVIVPNHTVDWAMIIGTGNVRLRGTWTANATNYIIATYIIS